MVVTETVYIDGREFTKTYSDDNKYVVREGAAYTEAYDPAEFGRTYTEGEEIPYTEPTEEEYAQAGRIMMGVEE